MNPAHIPGTMYWSNLTNTIWLRCSCAVHMNLGRSTTMRDAALAHAAHVEEVRRAAVVPSYEGQERRRVVVHPVLADALELSRKSGIGERVRERMATDGIPVGTDNLLLLSLGATPLPHVRQGKTEFLATVTEDQRKSLERLERDVLDDRGTGADLSRIVWPDL